MSNICCVRRIIVAVYARLLLRAKRDQEWQVLGITDAAQAVRCCLELRFQVYDSKIRLPKLSTHRFSHVDCDWKKGGCLNVPAPQCVVACSPNVVNGTRVWDARFVDVRKQVKSYHQSIGAASPYALPRACAGTGPFPSAKSADELLEPCTDYWQSGSGPDAVSTGDAIVFGHLTAHEFTQHSTVNQNDLDEGTPVPVDFTRTAEYPMYCSPLLHGQPHQGVDEVLAALLAGDLPARWAHVYTYAQHFHHPRPGSLRQWPWLTSPRPAQWQQTFHCDDREALQTGSSEPRGKSINALGSCTGWVGPSSRCSARCSMA